MPGQDAAFQNWQNILDETVGAIADLVGAVDFTGGGFTTNDKQALEDLFKQKAHAEHMLTRLGLGDNSTANVIQTQLPSGEY